MQGKRGLGDTEGLGGGLKTSVLNQGGKTFQPDQVQHGVPSELIGELAASWGRSPCNA